MSDRNGRFIDDARHYIEPRQPVGEGATVVGSLTVILRPVAMLVCGVVSFASSSGLAQNYEADKNSCIQDFDQLKNLGGADAQKAWQEAWTASVRLWRGQLALDSVKAKYCFATLHMSDFAAAHEATAQEQKQAIQLMSEAANAGFVPAMYAYGIAHLHGHWALRPDFAEAVRWIKCAANAGYSDANMHLGLMYLRGELTGGPVAAYRRLKLAQILASEQNDELMAAILRQWLVEDTLEDLRRQMSKAEKSEADAWVKDWRPASDLKCIH